MQFPQFWPSPIEFEPLWKDCVDSIRQACKRLHFKKPGQNMDTLDPLETLYHSQFVYAYMYRSVPLIRPLRKYAPPFFTAKVPA